MAFPDAAVPTAVPITTPDQQSAPSPDSASRFDPANPAALGYDPGAPAFSAAREEARADGELELAFRGQLRRETARFGAWAEAWCRRGGGGTGWAGHADPFRPTSPQLLLERARASLARRRAWARSPVGAAARRLAEAEAAAQALTEALTRARAALDRASAEQVEAQGAVPVGGQATGGTGRGVREFH